MEKDTPNDAKNKHQRLQYVGVLCWLVLAVKKCPSDPFVVTPKWAVISDHLHPLCLKFGIPSIGFNEEG